MARSRGLTRGEAELAALLFGSAVDYAKVRIHARRYMPFQPLGCAMTPNGSMYFHRSRVLDDFSAGDACAQHWFMHEMTHVWQHQLGYPVRLRGALRIGLSYRYELVAGKTLGDFNMEAQGDLLADYFVLKHLENAGAMRQPRYAGCLGLFEQVLGRFLADPGQRSELPRWRRKTKY
jgi:hypothetical protein